MKFKYYLVFAGIGFLSVGCNNDSISDLTEPETIENVTYTNNIKSIIDNNCIRCHKSPPENAAPMSMASYALLKDAIINRPLIFKISKNDGDPGLMPFGGPRLPQSSIDLIIKWKEQGLQE